MELSNAQLLPRPVDATWSALLDPAVLRECIPGCEEMESTGEHSYRIVMRAKVGPVAARFNGSLQLMDLDEPNGYTVNFTGQAGAVGFGKGSARVTLAPVPEGTRLDYTVQASVGGKIAQVGSRLVDSAAMMMANEFFERFEAQLREQAEAPGDAQAVAAASSLGATPGWRFPVSARWYVGGAAVLALLVAAAASLFR